MQNMHDYDPAVTTTRPVSKSIVGVRAICLRVALLPIRRPQPQHTTPTAGKQSDKPYRSVRTSETWRGCIENTLVGLSAQPECARAGASTPDEDVPYLRTGGCVKPPNVQLRDAYRMLASQARRPFGAARACDSGAGWDQAWASRMHSAPRSDSAQENRPCTRSARGPGTAVRMTGGDGRQHAHRAGPMLGVTWLLLTLQVQDFHLRTRCDVAAVESGMAADAARPCHRKPRTVHPDATARIRGYKLIQGTDTCRAGAGWMRAVGTWLRGERACAVHRRPFDLQARDGLWLRTASHLALKPADMMLQHQPDSASSPACSHRRGRAVFLTPSPRPRSWVHYPKRDSTSQHTNSAVPPVAAPDWKRAPHRIVLTQGTKYQHSEHDAVTSRHDARTFDCE
ncbi:hypothetical protein FA95DRAFT_1573803 [Auriscalpium vulgare]|uniref:Uncharacterized protein n=1 Tax=Auriscalpium vulgare TaxID=40419 RepID=A0ACB8RNG9_9AGAM|nr:hypothetical protein FA95DRAFT_1573803 [Auriscalpium vulgare]